MLNSEYDNNAKCGVTLKQSNAKVRKRTLTVIYKTVHRKIWLYRTLTASNILI